ncbi:MULTISPECIES: hypothetical protein [Gracilimonas]|jgi:hypothetical protein|uniref:Uncharacterized protein n=1 Tax=Gracilimonas sediminicola TaxID=2952158 RepID=A0A9X2L6G9_9BACT|nr:hypothetical protein [Gracilimonas sediminicola]MAL19401.1 hypothetical protein [Balneola sp.]MBE78380.1 hypothetical protein [Balneola sp.]MCP9292473.1 hypothetical protein [Gracilimonas sediminicola]|tara:strand:- start:1069 stop:1680 length:612 start_codon:yes stop_codon:yes gene_type:complete
MSDKISKKALVPATARIKTYFDTRKVQQNQSVLNFFPANADRKLTRDNYVSNPFPGAMKRRILGLSFELTKQFIEDDPANGIDARAIVNGLKDAAILLQADNDNKEFLRAPMSEFSNFAGTGIQFTSATNNTVDAVAEYRRLVTMKSASEYRLADPFDLAINQTVSLAVHFDDASVFPTTENWNQSGQGELWLRASMVVAEVE